MAAHGGVEFVNFGALIFVARKNCNECCEIFVVVEKILEFNLRVHCSIK